MKFKNVEIRVLWGQLCGQGSRKPLLDADNYFNQVKT